TAFALSRGMTMEQVQRVTGVSGLDIVDAYARLPEEVVPRLWSAIGEREPDRALPIEMAQAAPLTYFGGLAHGLQYADSVRTAVGLMIRSRALIADRLSMALHETQDHAELVVGHPADEIDQGRTAQCGAALAARMLTEMLGVKDAILAVEFAYPAYGERAVYERHFAAPITFNGTRNALVLRADSLDAPASHANLELFSYVEQHFGQLLRRLQQNRPVPALGPLRQVMAERAAISDFNAESIAAGAGLSLRAAQRLAQANGTTLKAMIEEVRLATAKELLGDIRITIETVADLVGYSDGRAFRRAFKRWTGRTPSSYRRVTTAE
ncbi:MAG: AraC family transcriptional regulator ligand-binding domain-containing protein, partial [Pseudomonadota bacterium]